MSQARRSEVEEWVIRQLQPVIDLSVRDRDALPGSVVKLVKEAQIKLKRRRRMKHG